MRSFTGKVPLWKIFLITAKIGGVTIGGGYAMVPVIKDEFVKRYRFLSDEEFTALLVIAQSLPGPIAVNTSALVGYKLRKLKGTICAISGAIFFPIVIILLIAVLISKFYNNLEPFLRGMKAPLFAILVTSVLKMWKGNIENLEDKIIFAVSFTAVSFLKFNPVIVIALAIIYSILRNIIMKRVRVK